MKSNQQLNSLKHKLKKAVRTKYISVSSGKGGVGKTLISINIGEILSESGKKVLIFDGDLGLSNVHLMYGIMPKKDLSDLIKGFATIEEIPEKINDNLYFISAGSGLQELADIPRIQLVSIISKLQEYAEDNYDYVIIDTPPGIHRTTIVLVTSSDIPIVISTPEPTSVADAYALIKIASKSINEFYFLVNKADNEAEAKAVYESVKSLTDKYTSAKVIYMGFLKFRKNMIRKVIDQSPIDEKFKEEIRKTFLNINIDVNSTESFWSKILKKLKK